MLLAGAASSPVTIEDLLTPELTATLDRLDLLSRKMLSGKLPGERRSKRRGRSVEFDDFRTYVPGDDPRHIDWNILARLDRLVVKLFREEEDLALHIILDASPSMLAGTPSKLGFAQRLSFALAYVGLVHHNRVGVGVFGDPAEVRRAQATGGLRVLAPMRGKRNLRRAGEFLLGFGKDSRPAESGPDASQRFAGAMRAIGTARAARGITLVLSDFLGESLEAGLNYLAGAPGGAPHDTTCLQILAPGEIDPAREESHGLVGDLRLTEIGTGRAKDVTVNTGSTARYRERFEEHQQRFRAACLSRGIAHVMIPSDAAVEHIMTRTLRRGGLLR